MLGWSLMFLVLSVISGLFGFSSVDVTPGIEFTRTLFFLFLVGFLICLFLHLAGPRHPDQGR